MATSENFMMLISFFITNLLGPFLLTRKDLSGGSSSSSSNPRNNSLNSHLPPSFSLETQHVMVSLHTNRSDLAASNTAAEGVVGDDNRNTRSQDKNGRKSRVYWTHAEDSRLQNLVEKYGVNWSKIGMEMGNRSGKRCRERWSNHLQPNIKKEAWTEEEEQTLIKLHKKHGNKWAEIAREMPGRAENSIKNLWYSTQKKQGSIVHPTLRQYINELDVVETYMDLSHWPGEQVPSETMVNEPVVDRSQDWITMEMNYLREILP